ncbi:MAG TPA: hypothetical protein VGG04_16565 [Candidatus Sulfotelmatobacter sp.]|jgi:hypothetical protein
MRRIELPVTKFALALAAMAVLISCSVNVRKESNGEDKQVDIKTPMGSVHVSKGADPQDVGIVVYPGARLKESDDEGGDKSANVSVSGFGYGVKVAALEYESNDAPEKVVAFYQDQLKRYGNVLVCRTSHFHVDTDIDRHSNSHELTCEGSGGVGIELKAGSKENQHLVAIEPEGSGSKFSLVYVRVHGKEADL